MEHFLQGEFNNFPQIHFLKEFLIGHPGFIAGGCFKSIFSGTKPSDIDMFFEEPNDYHKTILFFKENEDYTPGYENKNVQSFIHKKTGIRIECIRKVFGSPGKIIGNFDFTIAKFAYVIEAEPPEDEDESWTYHDKVIYHPMFFEHLCMKRLVIDDKIPFPISTFERTYKYAQKGFLPCRETKIKLISSIYEMDKLPKESDFNNAFYEGMD